MSFFTIVEQYQDFDFTGFFDRVTDAEVARSLSREKLSAMDFLTLLSPRAAGHLEQMA